jgi:hypothetical protein
MANTIKQYKNTIFAGAGLFSVLLTILVLGGIVYLPNFADFANADATSSVSVTATIQQWLSFSLSTTTASLGNLVDTSGNLYIGSATSGLTLSSNSDNGYSVTIQGANGGLKNGATSSIATAASGGTSTCTSTSPGADAYGAQISDAGALTISSPFNVTGNTVGSVASTTAQKLVSSVYSASAQTATLTVKASANKFDKDGTYTDTLTLTLTGTP